MKLFVALLASTFLLSACGGFNQDPIEGAPDAVRNGQPPEFGKPVQEKPYPKEALQIDVPAFVNGFVDSPMEIKIEGRVAVPGVAYQLTILNLAEFEGATFNPSTGDFKWTPGKSIVGSAAVGQAILRIQIATIATTQNPIVSSESKNVTIIVTNSYTKPMVISMTGASDLEVGKSYFYDFVIEDRDAVIADNAAIIVRNCPMAWNRESLFGLVEQSGSISNVTASPNRFKGRVIVDLGTADTLKSGNYCFAISAVSKSGLVSDLYLKTMGVESRIRNSKMTLESYLVLNVGEKMQATFSFYDPSADGILRLKNIEDINAQMPGSKIECVVPSFNKSTMNCSAAIDATSTKEGTYTIKMDVDTTSRKTSKYVTTSHWLKIQVKAAP